MLIELHKQLSPYVEVMIRVTINRHILSSPHARRAHKISRHTLLSLKAGLLETARVQTAKRYTNLSQNKSTCVCINTQCKRPLYSGTEWYTTSTERCRRDISEASILVACAPPLVCAEYSCVPVRKTVPGCVLRWVLHGSRLSCRVPPRLVNRKPKAVFFSSFFRSVYVGFSRPKTDFFRSVLWLA